MSRLRHPLIVAALIAVSVMLIVLALSPSWAARSIAANLRKRIAAADEPSAASLVESLAALEAAALPHLIELLDDPRPSVRQGARRAMSQRLDAWSDERTTTSGRNIEQLAFVLATHDPPREFHSRALVKLLALRLLRCSDNVEDDDRVEFLANCSTILERSLNAAEDVPIEEQAAKPGHAPITFEWNDANTASIPLEPYSPPMDDGESTDEESSDSDDSTQQQPARIELHQPRPIGRVLDAPDARLDEAALRRLPTRSLIRRLHDVPAVARLAEEELRQRGFDDPSLEIARQLDHADPQVRQQLAESLPRMTGIDAAPWLWELAEDDDENVRRAARNILATSSNPQTRARVARLR